MKKLSKILALSFVFAVGLALAARGTAFADLIAGWNYNAYDADNSASSSPPDDSTNPKNPRADMGVLAGSASASQTQFGTLTRWGYNDGQTPAVGTPPTYPGDYSVDGASGLSDKRYRFVMSAANPAGQLTGLRWNVSTVGYENISVHLGIYGRSALTGDNANYRFDYSLDGTTWSNNPVTYSGSSWTTFDLLSIVGAANNPNFAFRFVNVNLTAESTLTTDWAWVEGTPTAVPIPAAAWLLGSGLVSLVVIRRRKKR